jgi:riboflavin synthase
MFTGIIQEIGTVHRIVKNRGQEFTVICNKILGNIHYGDSISVNGTCQTVTSFDSSSFTFFSMAETLEITNLSQLKVGSKVNLESSLTLNSLLGGHLIMGHIDGIGEVASVEENPNSTLYRISIGEELTPYIVKKGSIAIDGVSLTVYDIQDNIVTVAIIPTTGKDTTISQRKTGDKVNIETDLLAKYVEKLLLSRNKDWEKLSNNIKSKSVLTEDFLRKNGFI